MNETTVRIVSGALDDHEGSIILRGRIDPDSLDSLQTDDYQREIMPISTIREIIEGFKNGSVPDIDLGMRGDRVREKDEIFSLLDPVYIVDGLQRVSAAKQFKLEGGTPRLGAMVHFNTNHELEVGRFKILNADRNKLSPNVLLRNLRTSHEVICALHSLSCDDDGFVMKGRICWNQRSQRLHLITAVTLMKTTGFLHSHIGSGRHSDIFDLARSLQVIYDKVGRNVFRGNVRAMFQIIDECWGVKAIAFKEGASYLRSTFLSCLAIVLSNHEIFWRENRLFIEADLMRKLKIFPVSDPTVRQLSSAGGQARRMLYQMIVDHMNHGKRSHRLKERRPL